MKKKGQTGHSGGPKAVYDFEDPHVARSFLAPAASDLWAWLPWELAVDTLWSAGPRGAAARLELGAGALTPRDTTKGGWRMQPTGEFSNVH